MSTQVRSYTDLEAAWSRPPGLRGWVTGVQHRSIGARFIVTGVVFFLLAGIAAILMRIQLAVPEAQFLDADLYNQMFTMHGATMMFLFAVPIMQGIGIYIVPMMIGARDMAFPRLNAFGYWIYLFGGTALWISLFFGVAPNSGWFNYPPIGTARYQPGLNIDVYALAISMIEITAIVASIELVVSILMLRAPGMRLDRMPLFVWSQLIMGLMILVAMPTLLVATLLLELDNLVGTSFYAPGGGGDPLLWQHLFWFFGHPEVYIMLLPGLGIVAAITATFSRHEVVGYRYVVAAFVAIGILSFGVWVHHMFAAVPTYLGMGLFSVASFGIVIPSGVQIFATLATFAYGRLRWGVPLWFVFGFVFVFVMGGLTGVNVASVPFNLQVHDTYFVVAHFHYVILGGVLFPILGGLYYWFPKLTGRMLDDRLGRWSFWLIFLGVNLTFFPMHLLGLWGMPRRVYTYLTGLGWDRLNMLATVGAVVIAVGVGVYLLNAARSVRRGELAPADPWGGGTLEWSIPSPPPVYGFSRTPVVTTREPLWATDLAGEVPAGEGPPSGPVTHDEPTHEADPPFDPATLATSDHRRETMATSIAAAVPRFRAVQPTATFIPVLAAAAVAVTFLGTLASPWMVPIGLVLVAVALFAWARPSPEERDRDWLVSGPAGALPSNYDADRHGLRSTAWAGAAGTLLVLVVIIASLVASYVYLSAGHDQWPLEPVQPRDPWLPLLASLPLLLATLPLVGARRAIRHDDHRPAGLLLLVAGGLGALFVLLKVIEYTGSDHGPDVNVSSSLDWALTGFHLLFVLGFTIAAFIVGTHTWRGMFHADRADGVNVTVMLGHGLAVLWVPVFAVVYFGHALW